ncbi:MAG: hypothetical protein GX181_08890 [Synergistaceae bacterium]|nr:peptidyl-prolyl cis-trans isomerase [Synergistota bacterium]NLM72055.1 hypothetical protein [Synergistaceae bacterium]
MSGWKNEKRHIMLSVVLIFFVVSFINTAFASDNMTVLVVDDETVTVDEILYLLGLGSGGGGSAAALLAGQMTPEETSAFIEQVARAVLFSKGAIIRGLHLDPEVAAKIKWSRINTLAEAYVGSMAPSLSFTEGQLRAYYDEHRERYVEKEMVRARHILTRTEEQARTVLLRLFAGEDFSVVAAGASTDESTAKRGGELGWLGMGELPEPLGSAVFSASLQKPSGPVETGYGYHIFEALERKRARPFTFDEIRDRVMADMAEEKLLSEAASLGRRFPVSSDPAVLSQIIER